MDRRYVCTSCGMKWFDPLPDRQRPEPTTCAGCGGALLPLVARVGPRWFAAEPAPEDVGNGDL
jgi:hypothetical protein